MRFITAIVLAAFSAAQVLAAPAAPQAGQAIPNQYIVVFKADADAATVADHQAWLSQSSTGAAAPLRRRDGTLFPSIPAFNGFKYLRRFRGGANGRFRGYAANITPQIAETLKTLPEVAIVEQDTVVSIVGGTPTNPPPPSTTPRPTPTTPVPTGTPAPATAPWGLRRIAQRDLPLPSVYTAHPSAGEGINSYIIDTGILVSHSDFGGRARIGASFSTDNNDVDGNGHGTHVAGTVGGTTYGVAKKTTLIAVKVLSSGGSGSNSDVIAGVEWVARNATASGRRSVANMSLGGGASAALDQAVANAVSAGVTFVVAAGNSNANACTASPARAPSAITVAASDINDVIASFSNRGSCVDVIAPGVSVLSTWIGGNTATRSISGTSMASPHVAGIAAVVLSAGLATTPATVTSWITSNAVPNKITNIGTTGGTTPNLLAQVPK
ncbi:hypothetical protein HDU96_004168 [Phlyctochytrium bullatum]|nr:hypothetical protein HDU96_004168 [Phlyctochytrium bullatum]